MTEKTKVSRPHDVLTRQEAAAIRDALLEAREADEEFLRRLEATIGFDLAGPDDDGK